MQRICELTEIPAGTSKGFTLNGSRLFVVHANDLIRVYRNVCPHTGGCLNYRGDQLLNAEGDMIQCAIHGALFLIENGLCVSGPCNGRSLNPLPFRIQDGVLWLST